MAYASADSTPTTTAVNGRQRTRSRRMAYASADSTAASTSPEPHSSLRSLWCSLRPELLRSFLYWQTTLVAHT